ncbi:helix-turn-helix transcriptional regulator [Sphingobacterium sp. UT-1RO-CII-1]|uniref:helix-turn-helix domain-containing protein n=1 Tax=Sphingobacterium sp. UT-1RO-CII-1 TaxID=2995225 RepID=UPI00227A5CB4|nr:helix-turn-helix transcriptional regulator [Sphingobacterium sp. UT-1RO-CII-1]MCY4781203.1 helix-turn-helix transcriptional regulator [Sphingobacterium sp. UT-1RO-CII-1]
MKEITQQEFKDKLGSKIFELRTKSGLTQEQLAHKIGKDKQFINRYELEGANPTAYNLYKLARALDVTVDDLLDF